MLGVLSWPARVETCHTGEQLVKKGRHRRFEEARSLKRAYEVRAEPCPECGAAPGSPHASWCLHDAPELDDDVGEAEQDGAAGSASGNGD
jgi:hypothetical protein